MCRIFGVRFSAVELLLVGLLRETGHTLNQAIQGWMRRSGFMSSWTRGYREESSCPLPTSGLASLSLPTGRAGADFAKSSLTRLRVPTSPREIDSRFPYTSFRAFTIRSLHLRLKVYQMQSKKAEHTWPGGPCLRRFYQKHGSRPTRCWLRPLPALWQPRTGWRNSEIRVG